MPSSGLTPEQRSLRGRIAAHSRWAQTADRAAATAAARQAFIQKFADQVDPEHQLPAAERERRGEHARRAHMASLALKSARARSKSQELAVAAVDAEAEFTALGGGSDDAV